MQLVGVCGRLPIPSSLASRLTFTFNSFIVCSFLLFLQSAALAEDSVMSGNRLDDFLLEKSELCLDYEILPPHLSHCGLIIVTRVDTVKVIPLRFWSWLAYLTGLAG